MLLFIIVFCLILLFSPSQQFFSYVRTDLPKLNQCYADVPARLAHFTHSASIFEIERPKGSVIRGRGTSIHRT